jgi:hypothetical protein
MGGFRTPVSLAPLDANQYYYYYYYYRGGNGIFMINKYYRTDHLTYSDQIGGIVPPGLTNIITAADRRTKVATSIRLCHQPDRSKDSKRFKHP